MFERSATDHFFFFRFITDGASELTGLLLSKPRERLFSSEIYTRSILDNQKDRPRPFNTSLHHIIVVVLFSRTLPAQHSPSAYNVSYDSKLQYKHERRCPR